MYLYNITFIKKIHIKIYNKTNSNKDFFIDSEVRHFQTIYHSLKLKYNIFSLLSYPI